MTESGSTSPDPSAIRINRAELAGGFLTKHVVFKIQHRGAEVTRRYSDFVWMRHWLSTMYAGVWIPPLPPAIPIALWPDGYLAERKADLQRFLNRIRLIEHLEADKGFGIFLHKPDAAFADAKKAFDVTRKKLRSDKRAVLDKLRTSFPQVAEDLDESHAAVPQSEMTDFVEKECNRLTVLYETGRQLVERLKRQRQAAREIGNVLNELDQLEAKFCVAEQGAVNPQPPSEDRKLLSHRRPMVGEHMQRWAALMHEGAPIFNSYMVEVIKHNMEDMAALYEIITCRDELVEECQKYVARGEKWRAQERDGSLRSKDIDKKNVDAQLEAQLLTLSAFVKKLVALQFRTIFVNAFDDFSASAADFANVQIARMHEFAQTFHQIHTAVS